MNLRETLDRILDHHPGVDEALAVIATTVEGEAARRYPPDADIGTDSHARANGMSEAAALIHAARTDTATEAEEYAL